LKILIKNTASPIRDKPTTLPAHPLKSQSSYETGRYGAWGIVHSLNSEDASVNVLIDGLLLDHIPVASHEWVVPYDDFVSGERNLPPVNARIFVLMPTGNFDNCFVLCSGFSLFDPQQRESITAPSAIGDDISVRKTVMPGNWTKEYTDETGTLSILSPDKKTSLLLDYREDEPQLHISIFEKVKLDVVSEDSVKVSIFDAQLTIDSKGAVTIKSPQEITIEGKKLTVEADNEITVNAPQVKVTGGKLEVKGSTPPEGQGSFCAVSSCLFTGAPHTGTKIIGT
jgi:hypothetical protein